MAFSITKYLERRLREDGDEKDTIAHKCLLVQFMFVVMLLIFIINLPKAVGDWSKHGSMPQYFFAGTVPASTVSFFTFVYVWRYKGVMPLWLLVANTITYCWLISYQDMLNMRRLERYWYLFVVLIDWLLVIRAPHWLSGAVVVYVCLYILLTQVEMMTRFGLLDIGLVHYDTREELLEKVDCANPPCATGSFTVSIGGGSFTTFIVDYFLTRRFAVALHREKESAKTALRAVETIGERLCRFDLTAASNDLADIAPHISLELHTTLTTLIENLASYRPYLPHELFACDSPRRAHSIIADVPGALTQTATVVFTDIKSSTSMWAANAAAMRDALEAHNTIVRDCARAHRGYEVKTIGDSFMLAYHSPLAAVSFALELQRRLAQMEWPAGLERAGMEDGFPTLVVRLGIHIGHVLLERNVVTGRYDYFGATVNIAARVESMGIPGAVTLTDAVLAEVREDVAGDAAVGVVPFKYERFAKGLPEPLWLTALVPRVAQYPVAAAEWLCGERQDPPPRLEGRQGAGEAPMLLVSQLSGQSGSLGTESRSRSRQSSMLMSMESVPGELPHTVVQDYAPPMPLDNSPRGASQGAAMLLQLGRCLQPRASVSAVRFNTWQLHESMLDWEHVEARGSRLLANLEKNVIATGGHLQTVVNDVAYISWNVHSAEPQHVAQAVRFVMMMHANGGRYHAGLAAGPVVGAQLGSSSTRRFMTLMGPAVTASNLLLAGAQELEVRVLLASLGVDAMEGFLSMDFLRPHLSHVDTWSMRPAGGDIVDSYWAAYDDVRVFQVVMGGLCAAHAAAKDEVVSGAPSPVQSIHSSVASLQHAPLRLPHEALFRVVSPNKGGRHA